MSGEKTEEATEKKKEDSREEGQVAISKDVQTLAKILFFYITCFSMLGGYAEHINKYFNELINTIFVGDFDYQDVVSAAIDLFIYITMPLVCVCMLIGFASTWVQIGFVVAPKALSPSFKKLNFTQNIKSMLSKKSFVQLLLSILKIVVLAFVAYKVIALHSEEIVLSYRSSLNEFFALIVVMLKNVIYYSLIVFIIFSFTDWLAIYFNHKTQLKMSKNEVKDETKQLYGDPLIKSQRRNMHRSLLSSTLQNVGQSKVVVANPTHISVALDYEPGKHDIPYIVCMGEDEGALLIRKRADELGIPIIRSAQLARQLYAECDEEQYIREQHLQMAAEVFKIVLSMSNASRS